MNAEIVWRLEASLQDEVGAARLPDGSIRPEFKSAMDAVLGQIKLILEDPENQKLVAAAKLRRKGD